MTKTKKRVLPERVYIAVHNEDDPSESFLCAEEDYKECVENTNKTSIVGEYRLVRRYPLVNDTTLDSRSVSKSGKIGRYK